MNICTGSSSWSSFFTHCEILLTIILFGIYLRKIIKIIRNQEINMYEKLDLLVIILSVLQIFLYIFFFVIKEYYLISLAISILKFSQNSIICCLLLVIIMWKYSSITFLIINYFMMIILISDIVFCIFGLIEYSPFETQYCKPKIEFILSLFGLIVNILVLCCSFYFSSTGNEEESQKNQLIDDDQYYINNIYNKYVDNIKKMMKSYLIITIFFLISFGIDILFNALEQNINIIVPNDNNKISSISDTNNTINGKNTEIFLCPYYGNFDTKFGFKEYLICCISFILRDLSTHLYIFFALFFFKPENISRSSSFIEAL